MRLVKARIQNYRSIHDTGWFDVEVLKTILVGPNEAGKTAILRALQQINPPRDEARLDPLRDFPRSRYTDLASGKLLASEVVVAEAHFQLDDEDCAVLGPGFDRCLYFVRRKLDNSADRGLVDAPAYPTYGEVRADLKFLLDAYVHSRTGKENPIESLDPILVSYRDITKDWPESTVMNSVNSSAILEWVTQLQAENINNADVRDRLRSTLERVPRYENAVQALEPRLPVFVFFNSYHRVRPRIHLAQLANRIASGQLDIANFDYGNTCLLKLLGFTAAQLSAMGHVTEPRPNDKDQLEQTRSQLDRRQYELNAASVRLTNQIKKVWVPNRERGEAERLRIQADGQYLKVVVEDDVGVEIELDQRSEGFQWLVSFFVVFFAEADEKHQNAILLLDEPGLSLHGLKQREFRSTLSALANTNQLLYTTHSPFLVGPEELDLVRVVDMTDRSVGTRVHSTVASGDPAALLPLQEALGYDLAQSLFAQERNLVLEGITDYWYIESIAQLLREGNYESLNPKIALIPAASAGKVVYFATILHAHKLKVAALLDSDNAGENAAKQETLVHTIGNRRIIRTADAYKGEVRKPQIEDLLRETLVTVAKQYCELDISARAEQQPTRSIVGICEDSSPHFKKYTLAKAFMRWTRDHCLSDLSTSEREQWSRLMQLINRALD